MKKRYLRWFSETTECALCPGMPHTPNRSCEQRICSSCVVGASATGRTPLAAVQRRLPFQALSPDLASVANHSSPLQRSPISNMNNLQSRRKGSGKSRKCRRRTDGFSRWGLGTIRHCGDGSLPTILFEIKGEERRPHMFPPVRREIFGCTYQIKC
jgi:hypothetical protein